MRRLLIGSVVATLLVNVFNLGRNAERGLRDEAAREDRSLLEVSSGIGLATVYRVLTQFEQAGLLERHHFESGKAVFELKDSSHHDHLVCLQCGRVEEFYDGEIEKRQNRVAKDRGFAIREHSLYLYADCTRNPCPYRPK